VVFISEYTGGGFGSKAISSHSGDYSGAAGEEVPGSGHDAHFARRRTLYRSSPSQRFWAGVKLGFDKDGTDPRV